MKANDRTPLRPLLILLLALQVGTAFAQRGDREGHVMEEVWKTMDVPEAPALTPEQGLESLSVAPGFRVELVAAEPLVEDPIAMRWDRKGRLWVVEMRGFMPNVDGDGEQEPVGQVVVLEDLDHDGRMDKSTTYLDQLVLARALLVVEDGVLIGEPPNLWFCRDTDDDLECDQKTRVAEYGDDHPDALEHTENGLLWAIDNWIYNAKSDRRFRWRNGKIEEEKTHFRGQWGISQDDWGRLYYNTNSRYLFVDQVPAEDLARNPHYSPATGGKGVNERVVLDEAVFSVRVNPGINRGYMKQMLREDGRLAVTTSVSGVCVYRGHQFPDRYRGSAFIPEPAGNAVTFHRLENREGDIGIDWEHATYDDPEWGQREFLASTDERFRPVDCNIGPDGALYIVDMYRGILQHQKFVTSFLRKQILERKLERPLGLGRIYRVVHIKTAIDHQPPSLESNQELLAALGHKNGWHRDTAQQLLVEGQDMSVVPALEELLSSHDDTRARVHALWTLNGLGRLEAKHVTSALDSDRLELEKAALRAGGDKVSVPRLVELTAPSEERRLRLHAAYALGRNGTKAAQDRLIELLEAEGDNVHLRQAAASGLAGAEVRAIVQLTEASKRKDAAPVSGEVYSELASILAAALEADQPLPGYEAAVARLAELPDDLRPSALEELEKKDSDRTGSASAFERDDTRMMAGKRLYSACESCHGEGGAGLSGMAPGLIDARFLLGAPDGLIRIVLDGLEGPLESGGEEWDDIMPGFEQDTRFTDDAIASLLTFVRGSWGNDSAPVTAEEVARVRAEVEGRQEAWSVDEIRELQETLDN